MRDDLHFYLERDGRVTGPVTDDRVRDALRAGKLGPKVKARLEGSDLFVSPRAFATLARGPDSMRIAQPAVPTSVAWDLPSDLASTPAAILDVLLFWVHEGTLTYGPLTGAQIRHRLEMRQNLHAAAVLVDRADWFKATCLGPSAVAAVVPTFPPPSDSDRGALSSPSPALYFGDPATAASALPSASQSAPITQSLRCPICLESIPPALALCPECGEAATAAAPSPVSPSSIPDDTAGKSWPILHWRPLLIMGVLFGVVFSGLTLRTLAPNRVLPPRPSAKAAPASAASPPCASVCWSGESCESGHCVWQPPTNLGHVASSEPDIAGPFPLGKDATDALPIDDNQFMVSQLTGLAVINARTGNVAELMNDAPQSRRLFRVGSVVYATAPQRIYVVDVATTRLLKTIETGSAVSAVTLGASGRRALASLPAAHAVAVLATEYHAEIDRIQFGDDAIGPIGADETGQRALATTGQVPVPGLREPSGGAVYAFDPSRLASAQDRVRASMVGNPVSVLMTPDGRTSYVVLRAEDALVPMEWQPSGTVRQEQPISTCREPEQIELVRRGRLGIVRCNEGRAIEIFDLQKRELLHHLGFHARVADLAVSPDGRQAVVALPAEGAGAVGFVNLETFAVRVVPVAGEPTRVRLSPQGTTALVIADRSKVAWVFR